MHAVVFGHGTNEILFRLLHLVVDGQRPVAGTKKNSVKFPDFSFFFSKTSKNNFNGFSTDANSFDAHALSLEQYGTNFSSN